MNKLPKVLYISSANPLVGPGTGGFTHFNGLKRAGVDVDFLTLYKVEGHPEIMYVKSKPSKLSNLFFRIKRKVIKLLYRLPEPGYYFFYEREEKPPITIGEVLRNINKPYDYVIIWFWQGLLSFATIDALYEKLHCEFLFLCADYSVMSGGCHFTGDCERYKVGCGKCPAWRSEDEFDFTRWNVMYRKKVYEKVKPIVSVNKYMKNFYFDNSYLLRNGRVVEQKHAVDSKTFHPIDKMELRKKYGVDDRIKFIIGFGAQHLDDERKGYMYFIEAMELFYNHLSEEERNQILLLSIGHAAEKNQNKLPFEMLSLGYVSKDELSDFYSLTDVFVCPSVNDAGPSMVAQSISCGTPVVGFEMGAMLDWVLNRGTGYCSPLRDSKGLMANVDIIYRMTDIERQTMSNRCREVALNSSFDHTVEYWLELYQMYSEIDNR